MSRPLSDRTLEELWQLFPILLTEHNPQWPVWYQEERQLLDRILPKDTVVLISHVGSTAVPTIWAKPTVDILVEVTPEVAYADLRAALATGGYTCMKETPGRLTFNKGYTPDGFAEKVFHLHLRRAGDNDELYFRDFLLEHPDTARVYEELKRDLWKKHEHNRDAYTDGKSSFVQQVTQQAKALYDGRYDGKDNQSNM